MTGDGRAIRRLIVGAVLLVASIAAAVSFIHIEHLAVTHGQTAAAALLLPVSVDGTVAAASLSMLWAARAGLPVPGLARVMLGLGVAATLAANVAYGSPFGLTGELLSGWPAAAFIGSVELLIGMIRSARCAVPEAHPVVRFPIGLELAGVASAWPAPPAVPVASAPVPAALAAAPEPVPAGVPAPEADAPAPAGVPDAAPAGERSAPEPLRQAAELFAAELAGGDVPSIRAIRSRLHVGQPKAREVQAYLETCTPAGRSIARLREEIREDAALSAQ